jgi:hypothetical protein
VDEKWRRGKSGERLKRIQEQNCETEKKEGKIILRNRNERKEEKEPNGNEREKKNTKKGWQEKNREE